MLTGNGHPIAARKGAGQLHGRRRHGRTILGEFYHVTGLHGVQKQLRRFQFDPGRALKVGSLECRVTHRLGDWLMAMADADGGEAHAAIYVFIAIGVPNMRTLAPDDHPGCIVGKLIIPLRIGMRPAGN